MVGYIGWNYYPDGVGYITCAHTHSLTFYAVYKVLVYGYVTVQYRNPDKP
jgi:hypothetical protein